MKGSPYQLPEDEAGEKIAYGLSEYCRSISVRQAQVQERFAEETQEVRDRIELMVGTTTVYESNALEQAGLPIHETRDVLRNEADGLNRLALELAKSAVERDKHLVEVIGLHNANNFAKALAGEYRDKDRPLTQTDLRNIHALVAEGETYAGGYKTQLVGIAGKHTALSETIGAMISGEEDPIEAIDASGQSDQTEKVEGVEVSSPTDVLQQMADLVDWINTTDANPALAASVVHTWLTHIHPFTDGNGRVARLLANLVLLRAAWPPLIVRDTDRLQYLESLRHSDKAGELLAVFQLFVKSINRELRNLERPGLAQTLFDADLMQEPEQRFEYWSNMVTNFLTELRNNLRRDPDIRLQRLFVPRFSTLRQLEKGDKMGNHWLAKITDTSRRRDHLIWLGYTTNEMPWSSPLPALFFGIRDRRPGALHTYRDSWEHCPFRVKEVAIRPSLGERPYLMRYAGGLTDWVTQEKAAAEVADSLIECEV
jgi:Fic family protein